MANCASLLPGFAGKRSSKVVSSEKYNLNKKRNAMVVTIIFHKKWITRNSHSNFINEFMIFDGEFPISKIR